MPSIYIQPQDYATYGVDADTTADVVLGASMRINSFLCRPDGLIWKPDANGNPCYMDNLVGEQLTVTSGAVSPGLHVQITVNRAAPNLKIGSILILDRENPEKTEAVVIDEIHDNVIQLHKVNFAHDADLIAEFGLTIVETQYVPDKRWLVQLSQTPVARIVGAQGVLAYPRRSMQYKISYNWQLMPLPTQFGGAPPYQSFDIIPDSFYPLEGKVFISPAYYLMLFTEVIINYVAGWSYAGLPPQIKMACANLINNLSKGFNTQFGGGIGMVKQGDTMVKKFADTQIDNDTRELLSPYMSHQFI